MRNSDVLPTKLLYQSMFADLVFGFILLDFYSQIGPLDYSTVGQQSTLKFKSEYL